MTAHATEIALAIPASITDIYSLHQHVWDHVEKSLAVRHRPTILYRREGGLVRVRISQSAVRIGRGVPTSARFENESTHTWSVHMALWRDVAQGVVQDAHSRVLELLNSAGVDVLDVDITQSVASGQKGGHNIVLPLASVQARVKINDAERAHQSWVEGIGRGRRFGFGMIDAA